MHLSVTTTLPLISTLLALTTAQESTDANGYSTSEPTSAYQIYSSFPDLTVNLATQVSSNVTNGTATNGTTNSKRFSSPTNKYGSKSRRSAHIPFTFHVSQDASNTKSEDLVVAFANLPCSGPGPFSFEFNFQPQSAYLTKGQGQINMFRVDVQSLGNAPST